MRVAEIDQHPFAAEIPLGDGLAVAVHQRERPADPADRAALLAAGRPRPPPRRQPAAPPRVRESIACRRVSIGLNLAPPVQHRPGQPGRRPPYAPTTPTRKSRSANIGTYPLLSLSHACYIGAQAAGSRRRTFARRAFPKGRIPTHASFQALLARGRRHRGAACLRLRHRRHRRRPDQDRPVSGPFTGGSVLDGRLHARRRQARRRRDQQGRRRARPAARSSSSATTRPRTKSACRSRRS